LHVRVIAVRPPAPPAGHPRPPLLGRAGRQLALLFPEESHRTRRAPVPAIVLAYLAAIAAGALVLLLRQAGRPPWDTLWAEDGTTFLPTALRDPWGSILQQYAGYLQLVPRLIADCVASLPLRAAAVGFAVAGALSASCCAVFTFRACAGHVRTTALRAVLAASVVLLPTALIEVANSGIDVPWYLIYALFWALLWRPRSGAGMAVAALIGMAAMSSQILAALYAPLAAARVIALPRAREQSVTFGLLAGGALQLPGLLLSRAPHHLSHPERAFSFYLQHVILTAVAGLHLAEVLQDRAGAEGAVVIAACAVALVAGWAFIRGGPRVRAFIVTAMGFGLLLTLFPAMVRSRVTIPGQVSPLWVPGERYTTAPILLIYAVVVVAADASLRRAAARPRAARLRLARPRPARPRLARLAAWVLLLALGAVWASDIRYVDSRSSYPSWPQALSSAKSRCLGRPQATILVPQIRAFLPCAAVAPGGSGAARRTLSFSMSPLAGSSQAVEARFDGQIPASHRTAAGLRTGRNTAPSAGRHVPDAVYLHNA
jgi:hypothetical protein